MLNNKSILITGGTGSFGKIFVKKILSKYPKLKKLVIFSRDELKQFEMSNEFPVRKFPSIRYFLGDVRDAKRLHTAFEDIDIVVHAAALKQVPTAEYNPMEYIKTNVIGAQNIIEAAIEKKVKKVIALSTDKAAAPINLYGATKLCSDKLFIAANNYVGKKKVSFSIVRYGNVMGSRGSIIPIFLKESKFGKLKITDKRMTRFNLSLNESFELVLNSIKKSVGGEIFVPKIPSIYITDLANAIDDKMKKKIIGIRPGEKLNEIMFSYDDSRNAIEFKDYYLLFPSTLDSKDKKKYLKNKLGEQGKLLSKYFEYNSSTNKKFLSIEEIKKINKTINDQLKI